MPDRVTKTLHARGAFMRRVKPLARKIVNGRRGAFQSLFAASYLAVGVSYVFMEQSPSRRQALSWLTDWVPLPVLGLAWIVAAGFGWWGSFRARPKDEWSFIALTAVPTMWGFLYIGSVIFQTNPFGWVTSILYWCIAGAVMVVSGMTGDHDRDEREIRAVRP